MAAAYRYDGLPAGAVPAIAALFGVEARLQQDGQPRVGPIWSIEHRSENGNLRLLLWPQLARVDVTCGPHSWIARAITKTEVLPGIEVIFRLQSDGLLTVAPTGHVVMAAPGRPQRS